MKYLLNAAKIFIVAGLVIAAVAYGMTLLPSNETGFYAAVTGLRLLLIMYVGGLISGFGAFLLAIHFINKRIDKWFKTKANTANRANLQEA